MRLVVKPLNVNKILDFEVSYIVLSSNRTYKTHVMKKIQYVIVTVIAIVILLIIIGIQMFFMIKPGERAVIFRKFSGGLDKENIYTPGFHVVAPWNDLIIYDVAEQESEESMDVLDKEGQSLNVDVTIIFNPFVDKIGDLHENIGTNYISIMVIPNFRNQVRAVTGRYTAEEIYSTKRCEVETEIINATRQALAENNIEMKDLLIRSISLPESIMQADSIVPVD